MSESNLGWLGWKRESNLCAMPSLLYPQVEQISTGMHVADRFDQSPHNRMVVGSNPFTSFIIGNFHSPLTMISCKQLPKVTALLRIEALLSHKIAAIILGRFFYSLVG